MSRAEPWERPVKRTVALAGATGLVGRSNLEGLLADMSVQSVHVLARCKSRVVHARLTCHIVDFAALSPLPPVDEVYLALGTTTKVAGSQAAFRAVDFDANPASRRELEKTRDAALTPFLSAIAAREEQARAKREAEQNLSRAKSRVGWRLSHVHDYLKKLEELEELEFEDFRDRWNTGERLLELIRSTLVDEVAHRPDLTDQQIEKRIEKLVDAHLEEVLDE